MRIIWHTVDPVILRAVSYGRTRPPLSGPACEYCLHDSCVQVTLERAVARLRG